MRKHAFTLIELLVVIAIIAIFAAILFPVFAQAKASAKSAASLSNLKQIITGAILYSGDYDDTFVPCQTWNDRQYIGGWSLAYSGKPVNSWRVLVYPYTKNTGLYEDPIATKHYTVSTWPDALNKGFFTQYGMNYMFMGPMNWNGTVYQKSGVSATAPANPASTVYFVQQYSIYADAAVNWTPLAQYEEWYTGLVDAPDCDGTPSTLLCWSNWGKNSIFETSLGLTPALGGRSGGVVPRNGNQVITTFADGHAKKLSLGALAAGTNFSLERESSTVGVIPAEKDKYMWDLE